MDKKKEKEEIEKYSDLLNTLIENKTIDNSLENFQNLTKNIQKLLTMEKGDKNYLETIKKINCKELENIIDKGGKDYIKILQKVMQKYLSKLQNELKSKNKIKIIYNNNVNNIFTSSNISNFNNNTLIFYFNTINNNNEIIVLYLIVINPEEKKIIINFNKENEIILNFNMIQNILDENKSNSNNNNIELKNFLNFNNGPNIEINESLNMIKLKEKVEENIKNLYTDYEYKLNLFQNLKDLNNIIKNIFNDKILFIETNNEKLLNKLYNN